MDWVSKGSFKGDLEMLDKSGNGVGKIHMAVKFERPGKVSPLVVYPPVAGVPSLPCRAVPTCLVKLS